MNDITPPVARTEERESTESRSARQSAPCKDEEQAIVIGTNIRAASKATIASEKRGG